jgi:maltodextrin utilization protein YvdJ
MQPLPYEEIENQDVEKVWYERKKLSIQRLTFLFFFIDIVLSVMVIIELFQWITRLSN